ncbi:MAG: deoxyuridine 5'-triphosphate nucleotidohydrolase [Proteobacteria bacterium SG_bin7]|nr:MAG: deoxyuridine 5'-triphosphate nucleotidohydrolase [Proteobacteria bacterium SG_bin7]
MTSKISIKVKTLQHFKGELPKYESLYSSGFDVRAQMKEPMILKPGQRYLVPTALSFEIPLGYEIQARPRSGLAIKRGITLLNTPGTIDADYRGEVKIIIANMGSEDFVINDQDRIAQLVICPVFQAEFVKVDDLSETARGIGGFGSTGGSNQLNV